MKILSIDVGIKNLAYCLFESSIEDNKKFMITKWDVINITEQESCKCIFIDKNGLCNKPAKFYKDDKCFCLKHSKKQPLQIPTKELKTNFINKQKIQKLYEIANKYEIKYEKSIKKAELLILINDFIYKTCFQEISTINASKIDLITIGKNIKHQFNNIFKEYESIDYVIIENQISPIANRMKTIQGMIAQYFIMSDLNVEKIEFISASNKLKDYDVKDKSEYKDRKKLSIQKCLEIITNEFNFNNMEQYFNKHTKKDDLADSFLQGMWFIKNKLP